MRRAPPLDVLAVNQQRAFETLTSEQRVLRNALRAKARQLGSGSQSAGFALLVEEVAYVQWHRMLFPLFLAENDLLMHPIRRGRDPGGLRGVSPGRGRPGPVGNSGSGTRAICCRASFLQTTPADRSPSLQRAALHLRPS